MILLSGQPYYDTTNILQPHLSEKKTVPSELSSFIQFFHSYYVNRLISWSSGLSLAVVKTDYRKMTFFDRNCFEPALVLGFRTEIPK